MGHRFDPKHVHKLDNPERRKLIPPEEILKLMEIKETDTIADVGCGTGYFTIPAASLTKGTVYGVDVEPEMLNYFKERTVAADISNIETVQSDAEHINLPDMSVDKIICSFVLHEVGDLNRVLKEFKRILKGNGTVLIVEWEKKETEAGPPVAERLESTELEHLFQTVGFHTRIVYPNPNHYIIIAS